MNFADGQIRVEFEVQQGYPRTDLVELTIPDRPPELVVARHMPEGLEVVGHTFTDEGFQLSDPVSGRYVFASTDQTCPAEPAEFAAGGVVADFELTPEVALPAELGVATFTGRTVPNEQVVVGTGADCSPIIEIDTEPRYHFELELDEQTLPWRDALRIAVEVDGEVVSGFGSGKFVGPSTMEFEYRDFCDGGEYALSPGIRELTFVARLDPDIVTVRSSPVSFACEEAPRPEPVVDAGTPDAAPMEPAPGEPSASGASRGNTKGCGVAHGASGDAWSKVLLLALLGVLGAARRRRATGEHMIDEVGGRCTRAPRGGSERAGEDAGVGAGHGGPVFDDVANPVHLRGPLGCSTALGRAANRSRRSSRLDERYCPKRADVAGRERSVDRDERVPSEVQD